MTAIKERPILFSAPMVQAILEGRKSMTRRICTCESTIKAAESFCDALHDGKGAIKLGENKIGPKPIGYICSINDGPDIDDCIKMFSPYGVAGNRLWVKEAFRLGDTFDKDSPSNVANKCIDAGYRLPWAPIQYEADGERMNWDYYGQIEEGKPGRLRSSMHMLRWASRILLEVTDVKIERLQDISQGDAQQEGPKRCPSALRYWFNPGFDGLHDSAKQAFTALWDEINGPGAWDANPFVWVISFRRIDHESPQ